MQQLFEQPDPKSHLLQELPKGGCSYSLVLGLPRLTGWFSWMRKWLGDGRFGTERPANEPGREFFFFPQLHGGCESDLSKRTRVARNLFQHPRPWATVK